MPTAQYLFRVYHTPLRGYFHSTSHFPHEQADAGVLQFEVTHSDHLTTLPGETSDLSHNASALAFADAAIGLRFEVWGVAVWQVHDDRPVNEGTPVAFFHPWISRGLSPDAQLLEGEWRELDQQPGTGAAISYHEDDEGDRNGLGAGFATYDLISSHDIGLYRRAWGEPWMACCVARAVESGRYKLQMLTRCVSPDDIYRSPANTLVLSTKGTLYNTRFPFWRQAVENLPYAHSGWRLNPDFSISRREIALTDRVCNCVSDLAQQRSMWLRRPKAVRRVARAWYETVRKLMVWFWSNQEHHEPRRFNNTYQYFRPDPNNPNEGAWINGWFTETHVRHDLMKAATEIVCDFVNMVAVATANPTLLLYPRSWGDPPPAVRFYAVQQQLRVGSNPIQYIGVKGRTQQHQILRAICDQTASIMERVAAFERAVAALPWSGSFGAQIGPREVARRRERAKLYNDFALTWPELQADLLGVLGLLMSWELTWDVAERTSATRAEDAMRNVFHPQGQRYVNLPTRQPVVKRAPDVGGRLAYDFPYFSPFRLWDVPTADDNEEQSEIDEERQRKAADDAAEKRRIEREEEERRQLRRARQQERINQLRADWMREHVPNPNDPWDYRNWTSRDWWERGWMKPADTEFYVRFAQTPLDINLAGARPRRARRKEGGPLKGWTLDAELYNPAPVRKNAIAWPVIRRVLVRTAREITEEVLEEAATEAFERLADQLNNSDVTYSPRQLWPPLL